MTRDDIIRMARDSGMELYGLGKDREKFVHYLQEFAALVAVAEREACARVVDPTEHHRRNASIYLGGNEGVELLEQTAEDIRARGQA